MDKIVKAYDGERWDQLAQRVYGDVNKMRDLMKANPQLPFDTQLTAGQEVRVPVIVATSTVITDSNKLPPWKR